MTLEEDIDDLVREAVDAHSLPDDMDVFYHRLHHLLVAVQVAAGEETTVAELLASLPPWAKGD